jgi:hypothetical protein
MMLVIVIIISALCLILASLSVEKGTKLAAVLLIILLRVLSRILVSASSGVAAGVVVAIPSGGISASSTSST